MTGMTLTRGESRRINSMSISLNLEPEGINGSSGMEYSDIRVAGGRDKVEECMNSVVPEAWITLNAGLLGQDIVILAFEISDDLLKPAHMRVSDRQE